MKVDSFAIIIAQLLAIGTILLVLSRLFGGTTKRRNGNKRRRPNE